MIPIKNMEIKMINGINHITISVKNIDSAFLFYKDILYLKPVIKSNRRRLNLYIR
jgi:predicted enzyme related to lactoylglutathione lyase